MTSLIAICGALVLQPAEEPPRRTGTPARPSSSEASLAPAENSGRAGVPVLQPASSPARPNGAPATVLVVKGASGSKEYGEQFTTWTNRWEQAATRGQADFRQVGSSKLPGDETDKSQLHARMRDLATSPSTSPVWLVLIGHGTYDGRAARFNLRGPDVSAAELASWLEGCQRPVAIINCTSSSGPFLRKVSAVNRVVVTATKSGSESNFARFGDHMSAAIGDASADVDQDGQTSLLEAWLTAARKTQEFYATDGRLATEHSLLDDNGDGLAVRADWFRGVRMTGKPAGDLADKVVDGLRAHQWHLIPSAEERNLSPEVRRKRDALELAVFKLRDQKATLPEDEYFNRLESLLVELAELYEDK